MKQIVKTIHRERKTGQLGQLLHTYMLFQGMLLSPGKLSQLSQLSIFPQNVVSKRSIWDSWDSWEAFPKPS